MSLLNYTTSVPVSRTVGQVQGLLVEAGARAIMAEYDDVGNVPRRKAEFTGEQLTKVAAAWRDGERG